MTPYRPVVMITEGAIVIVNGKLGRVTGTRLHGCSVDVGSSTAFYHYSEILEIVESSNLAERVESIAGVMHA